RAIWEKEAKRGKAGSAHKVFAVLRDFFGWLREEGITARPNPVESIKGPKEGKARQRTLSTKELALVWRAAGEMEYPFGPFVQLLILTLARPTGRARIQARRLGM